MPYIESVQMKTHGNFNGYCLTYTLPVLSPRVQYIASSNFLVAQFSLIRRTL
jgi:hypothetical protein